MKTLNIASLHRLQGSTILLLFIYNLFYQTHLTFGREFTQAVELKQVAQQEAERAKFLVEKASYNPKLSGVLYFSVFAM